VCVCVWMDWWLEEEENKVSERSIDSLHDESILINS